MTLLKIALVALFFIVYTVPSQALGDFSTVQIRNANSPDISNVVFGPVEQKDTLWKIAKDYRNSPDYDGQKTLSLYPVMYAIYLKNPQAFIDNNVNHLRNDVMLEMPSASFINSLDLDESERKIENDESKWGYKDSSKTEKVATDQQKINEIRAQYALSLETIQLLLEENQKLSTQVNEVAQRVNTLANQVNGDVRNQLEEQAELQTQLFTLLNNTATDDPAEQISPWVHDVKAFISEPLVVIGIVSLTVLVSLIISGLWLFRRKQPEDVRQTQDSDTPVNRSSVSDNISVVDDPTSLKDITEVDYVPAPDDISLVDNVPAVDELDTWLTEDSDKNVLDEIENVDFDDLLDSLDKDAVTQEEAAGVTKLSDDILDDLSFDSFTESSFDDSHDTAVTEPDDLAVDDSGVVPSKGIDADTPEYLDVDTLLQKAEAAEIAEPELDVLKNIPGIPDAVPSSDLFQDDVLASNLDLARTYIEIEEYIEAQALLARVVKEGTDEQATEAKVLIEQLKSL
jgi:pilus assembly protein FimV